VELTARQKEILARMSELKARRKVQPRKASETTGQVDTEFDENARMKAEFDALADELIDSLRLNAE
jgi:hypothetical protein